MVALLILVASMLRIVAYVVDFLLIDSIWLSLKLCLYASFSLKVVRLYEADMAGIEGIQASSISYLMAFGVFKVIAFLMECPVANAMPLSEQERKDRRNARKRLKRQNETPDERSNRLQSERERMASISPDRNRRRQSQRQSETNQQRAERCADARMRWSNISQEQNQRRRSERQS